MVKGQKVTILCSSTFQLLLWAAMSDATIRHKSNNYCLALLIIPYILHIYSKNILSQREQVMVHATIFRDPDRVKDGTYE